MTQIATVKRLTEDGRAELLIRRAAACAHSCESCGGCGPEGLSQVTAIADNDLHARPGDTVLLESESRRMLGMAAVLYLFPFLLLFAGYFLASGPLGLGEAVSAAAGLAGLCAGFGASFLLDRRIRTAHPVQIRIAEVVKPCSDT